MHRDRTQPSVQRAAYDVVLGLPGELPAVGGAHPERPPAGRQRAYVPEHQGHVPDELPSSAGRRHRDVGPVQPPEDQQQGLPQEQLQVHRGETRQPGNRGPVTWCRDEWSRTLNGRLSTRVSSARHNLNGGGGLTCYLTCLVYGEGDGLQPCVELRILDRYDVVFFLFLLF